MYVMGPFQIICFLLTMSFPEVLTILSLITNTLQAVGAASILGWCHLPPQTFHRQHADAIWLGAAQA